MNQMQAGLPNQVDRSASGFVVGDTITSAEIGSYFYRNGNSEMWLKHGVVLAAAGYPQAKLVEFLRTHGLAGTQTTATNSAYGEFATNGAGRWVFAYGHATNVLVSVDDQVTWAAVLHNCSKSVTSVTWSQSLGLFIGGGNDASNFGFCTQTAAAVASTWTARSGTAVTTATSNATIVRAGPNEVVAVCKANGGGIGQASYSTNGTTWAAKNFASSLNGALESSALVDCGGSNWYYQQTGGAAQRSTDGQTWTNVTPPSNNSFSAVFAFNKVFSVDSTGNLWSSPSGATGTWTALGVPLSSNRIRRLYTDGVRLYATLVHQSGSVFQPAFAWSPDGSSWFVRGLMKTWNVESALGVYGNRIGAIPMGDTGSVYSSFDNPDYVGIPWMSGNPVGSLAVPVLYTKIKG